MTRREELRFGGLLIRRRKVVAQFRSGRPLTEGDLGDTEKNLLCRPNPSPDTATDWIPATCIAQRALATWLGDADLSAWMERARLNAARGISDHHADPRMKSALARMFANAGPAVTRLEAFQAQAGQPSRAYQRPS